MRGARVFGLALLVSLLASPPAGAAVLRLATPSEPLTADVQRNSSYFFLALNIFDRLVECAPDAHGGTAIVPGLAERWEISPDGLSYTFYLRPGVRFHNGAPLSAADVAYTFDRMLDPKTKAVHPGIFDFVAGARERLSGAAESTPGFEVLDPLTVRVRLTSPYAPFLSLLASPQASIYNREFTRAAGERFGLYPATVCGTGPFRLKEYVVNSHQILAANPGYYQGPPGVDEIQARVAGDAETLRLLFAAGDIDILDVDQVPAQAGYFLDKPEWRGRVVTAQRLGLFYLAVNNARPPFDDVRARQALRLSLDRDKLLTAFFSGQGRLVDSVMPPGLVCAAPGPRREPDLAAARELLERAGLSGAPFEIAQVAGWPPVWEEMTAAVAAMAEKAGFSPNVTRFDEAGFYSTRRAGQAPAYIQVWSADFNDPDNFFHTFFSAQGSRARSVNLSDAGIISGVEQARFIQDKQARCREYVDLSQRIVDGEAVWLPLFSLDHLYLLGPRVTHFTPPWNGWSDMNHFATRVR